MKRIFWCVFIEGICLFIINFYFNQTNFTIYENKSNVNFNNNFISMMIETDANSGIYQESNDSLWPQDGYIFNNNLSKCENGSILTWDDATKKVLMKGNNSDKCYVYFDVVPPILLADHIKSKYTSQGAGGLYLHNSSLANGANDNSYRYAGANPNNYVCFGTNVTPCPEDNLYRIIGVFGDQVKVIKSDYATTTQLGTDGAYDGVYNSENYYYWNNSTNNNNWNESNLNKINLNTNYINNLGSIWTNKIATTIWKVGGNTFDEIINTAAADTYKNEIVTPMVNLTYNAKIGIMYVSDYAFAAKQSAWIQSLNIQMNLITTENWMYIGDTEWTISRMSDDTSYVFHVVSFGGAQILDAFSGYAHVRPVFYLTSSVSYASGNGTQEDPIRIVV